MIDVHKPNFPFIVLQDLRNERIETNLHVLSALDNGLIKLGRGHENEVRIPDISVSRFHSSVKITKNGFYLEDNGSKFGTLVLAKKPVLLKRNSQLAVQCKRTIIYFSLKEPFKFLSKCFACCITPDNRIIPDAEQDEVISQMSNEENEDIDSSE